MRIVHFISGFGGGAFTLLSDICNEQVRQYNEVIVLYSKRDGDIQDNWREKFDKSIIFHEIQIKRELSLFSDTIASLKVASLLKKFQPQIVHLHTAKAGFMGRIICRFLRMHNRTYYTPHGISFLQQDRSRISKAIFTLLEKFACYFGGTFIVCSESEKTEIQKILRIKQIHVVENSVNLDSIPVHSKSKKQISVGIVGRICNAKDPARFVKISRELIKRGIPTIWIGGGTEVDEAPLKQAGIEVTGWLTHEQALDRMKDLTVYLQTSAWEGMPISVIEAQASGIPAVVTDVVGNRDVIINGLTGYICKTDEEIIEKISYLINNKDKRISMGKRARESASERFCIKTYVEKLNNLYAKSS